MILCAEHVSRQYFRRTGGANVFYAVKEADLALSSGTITVLSGRSGSGKTTLLHMLAGLLAPTAGKVRLDETDLYSLSDRDLSRLRNERTAVVPQGRSTVDTLSVLENILLPISLYKNVTGTEQEAAEKWMEQLGILHLENVRAAELSGGELRRVAIARALTGDPDFILADEPTGDLDDENTRLVLEIFRGAAEEGKGILLVSHEAAASDYADKLYRMESGQLTISQWGLIPH